MKKLFDSLLVSMEKRSQNAGKYQKIWLYGLYGYIAFCIFFSIWLKSASFLLLIPFAVILYIVYIKMNKFYKKKTENLLKRYKN